MEIKSLELLDMYTCQELNLQCQHCWTKIKHCADVVLNNEKMTIWKTCLSNLLRGNRTVLDFTWMPDYVQNQRKVKNIFTKYNRKIKK